MPFGSYISGGAVTAGGDEDDGLGGFIEEDGEEEEGDAAMAPAQKAVPSWDKATAAAAVTSRTTHWDSSAPDPASTRTAQVWR